MDIVYASNHKYSKYLYVSLLSLFESHVGKSFNIHILSTDMTDNDYDSILALAKKFDSNVYMYYKDINYLKQYCKRGREVEILLRLFMPWSLPLTVKKVLYLDVDVLINKDICDLFDVDLYGHAMAACMDCQNTGQLSLKERNDIFKRTSDFSYYNSGVMCWNLDYIRNKYCLDDFIKIIPLFGDRLYFEDQDILNYMFGQNTILLDKDKYNYLVNAYEDDINFDKNVAEAHIIHYAGGSPWKIGMIDRRDIKMWWNLAKRTPYYDEICSETLKNVANSLRQIRKSNDLRSKYIIYKEKGWHINDFIIFKECKRIAVYGAGVWGKRLINELDKCNIDLIYVFDKQKKGFLGSHNILPIEDIQKANDCDCLIITPLNEYESIARWARENVSCKIVSINDCFTSLNAL